MTGALRKRALRTLVVAGSALLLASSASALSAGRAAVEQAALESLASSSTTGPWAAALSRRQSTDPKPDPDAVAEALSEAGTVYPTLASDAATATPTDGSPQKKKHKGGTSAEKDQYGKARGAQRSRASSAAPPSGSQAAQTAAGAPTLTSSALGLLTEIPSSTASLFGGQILQPAQQTASFGSLARREEAKSRSKPKPKHKHSKGHAHATAITYMAGALGCQHGKPSGVSALCVVHESSTHHAHRSTSSPAPTRAPAPQRRQQAEFTFTPGDGAAPLTFTFGSIDSALPPVTLSPMTQSIDGGGQSGNGAGAKGMDVNNLEAPDIGWVDTIIGGIPYKNGDLAASIVWILATLLLVPLFLVRLFRRSSLIANVLFTIFLFGVAMLATFGIRAYISDNPPTTPLMIGMNAMLAVMPPLLLEPLLNLLGLYARQGQAGSGVPTVTTILRVFNLVALILYSVSAAYLGVWLNDWERTLMDPDAVGALSAFPSAVPPQVVRLAPIIGSFFMLVAIAGGLLLIPVARGENGSMRPGGFLAVLLILIGISTSYRILQSLHAQARLQEESGGDTRNPFADIFGLSDTNIAAVPSRNSQRAVLDDVYRAARGFQLAPVGMYEPGSQGIAWGMLQQALAGRGNPQTPLVFNLVYIFPMWLQTFLLFFVHAPGGKKAPDGGA